MSGIAAAVPMASGVELADRDAWSGDLAFLIQAIKERHPDPFNRMSATRFDEIVGDVRKRLASAQRRADAELELVRVAAAVGDGHTNVQPWERYSLLPLRWAWFGDELRVTAAAVPRRDLLRLRVTRLGALPLSEVRARVQPYIAQHESPTFELNWSQYLLRMPEVLVAVGAARDGEPVDVEFLDDAGTVRRVALAPVPRGDYARLEFSRPWVTPPLSARRPDQPFWFERIDGTSVIYVGFSGYPPPGEFIGLAQRLVAALEAPGVTAVLFDLRQNGGGDFKLGRRFIEFIRPAVAKAAARVYVAIGRATYSAGMANATDLKRAFGAVYVGETSGARPNGYQESSPFVLPGSRVPGSVAREYYRFQHVDSDGLAPDVPVPLNWNDYDAGIDAVVDRVVDIERKRSAGPDAITGTASR